MPGRFVVLEGVDGAGKTTQARLLIERLGGRGDDALLVREPGGTPIGERVRAILLDAAHGEMDVRAELLLYMAARAQLVADVIRPALAAGRLVVSDRYLLSSVVYQGHALGLGRDAVLAVGAVATGGLEPDRTVVLDLEPARATERTGPARESARTAATPRPLRRPGSASRTRTPRRWRRAVPSPRA